MKLDELPKWGFAFGFIASGYNMWLTKRRASKTFTYQVMVKSAVQETVVTNDENTKQIIIWDVDFFAINSGLELEAKDFDLRLGIEFPTCNEISEATIIKKYPEQFNPKITIEDKKLLIEPTLVNKDNKLLVRLKIISDYHGFEQSTLEWIQLGQIKGIPECTNLASHSRMMIKKVEVCGLLIFTLVMSVFFVYLWYIKPTFSDPFFSMNFLFAMSLPVMVTQFGIKIYYWVVESRYLQFKKAETNALTLYELVNDPNFSDDSEDTDEKNSGIKGWLKPLLAIGFLVVCWKISKYMAIVPGGAFLSLCITLVACLLIKGTIKPYQKRRQDFERKFLNEEKQ